MTQRRTNRWIGIGIAALVVGVLAIYAMSAGNRTPATSAAAATPVAAGQRLFADTTKDQTTGSGVQTVPSMSAGSIAGLLLKVGFVAVLLGGALWLLRRYAGVQTKGAGRTGAITIADTITLAQGRAVYVLDVGDKALLVGGTAQQLSLLAEVTEPGVLERLRTVPERAGGPLGDLGSLTSRLGTLTQGFTTPRAAAEPYAGQPGYSTAPRFADALSRASYPTPAAHPVLDDLGDDDDDMAALALRLRAARQGV